jgi:hypothetical protein
VKGQSTMTLAHEEILAAMQAWADKTFGVGLTRVSNFEREGDRYSSAAWKVTLDEPTPPAAVEGATSP